LQQVVDEKMNHRINIKIRKFRFGKKNKTRKKYAFKRVST